tara:strand:+ start:797 stop:1498 length:702 start_codon:yes stop_codon:yes gene_type:complete
MYETFISGELVDLCIPSEKAIEIDNWTTWLNNIQSLQNSRHGEYPKHNRCQYEYLEQIRKSNDLVLLIVPKGQINAAGVICLQEVNLVEKSSDFAIIIGDPGAFAVASFASLEAAALIIQHGFEQIGLERIYSCSPVPGLKGWIRLLEIIGFKIDGIIRSSFRKGHEVSDMVYLSFLYSEFLEIKQIRGGKLWNGVSNIRKIIKKQPKLSSIDKLLNYKTELYNEHYKYLLSG